MSAVPNVPESLLNSKEYNIDVALTHSPRTKQASHIEYADGYSSTATNGTTSGHSEASEIPWLLHDTPIENQRQIKVIVVGAGYSGVYCGIRIPERLRNCELVIYEKNAGIGGKLGSGLQQSQQLLMSRRNMVRE